MHMYGLNMHTAAQALTNTHRHVCMCAHAHTRADAYTHHGCGLYTLSPIPAQLAGWVGCTRVCEQVREQVREHVHVCEHVCEHVREHVCV